MNTNNIKGLKQGVDRPYFCPMLYTMWKGNDPQRVCERAGIAVNSLRLICLGLRRTTLDVYLIIADEWGVTEAGLRTYLEEIVDHQFPLDKMKYRKASRSLNNEL